jgi:hypothetical protein
LKPSIAGVQMAKVWCADGRSFLLATIITNGDDRNSIFSRESQFYKKVISNLLYIQTPSRKFAKIDGQEWIADLRIISKPVRSNKNQDHSKNSLQAGALVAEAFTREPVIVKHIDRQR